MGPGYEGKGKTKQKKPILCTLAGWWCSALPSLLGLSSGRGPHTGKGGEAGLFSLKGVGEWARPSSGFGGGFWESRVDGRDGAQGSGSGCSGQVRTLRCAAARAGRGRAHVGWAGELTEDPRVRPFLLVARGVEPGPTPPRGPLRVPVPGVRGEETAGNMIERTGNRQGTFKPWG